MRVVVVLALLVACGGSPSPKSPAPPADPPVDPPVDASTPDTLTAGAARILRTHLPTATITIAEPLLLKVDTWELSLDKPWKMCGQEPLDCDAYTRQYLRRAVSTFTEERTASTAALRAIVRHRDQVAAYQVRAEGKLITEPLAGDLAIVYVLDRPEATQWLKDDHLAALQLTRAGAIERARQNLAAHLGVLPTQRLPEHGLDMIATGEYYESSRLLEHGLWKDVAASMPNGLIVAVPSNDVVLYGDDTAGARDAMGAIARDIFSKAEIPVSSTILRWTADGWAAP